MPSIAEAAGPDGRAKSKQGSKVSGRVLGDALAQGTRPLASAKVYAYEVATYSLVKVLTDRQGRFAFTSLPAGMYQIVAYKEGFAPTIELLLRKDPKSPQFVEIRMQDELQASARDAEGYWSVRGRLPADVLRDIGQSNLVPESMILPGMRIDNTSVFSADVLADGGVKQLGTGVGEAQVTRTRVALEGAIGSVRVGLEGQLQQLDQDASKSPNGVLADGEAHSLQLTVKPDDKSSIRVSTGSGELSGMEAVAASTTRIESYGVEWQGATGEQSRSKVTASYTEEANFHRANLGPYVIPGASRTFDIEGQFRGQVSEKTALEAGLAYRQQIGQGFLPSAWGKSSTLIDGALDLFYDSLEDESVGLYTRAESQLQPKVLIEYGLFSSVRDGSLSLTPHGGLVVQIGNDWQARTSVSHRLEEEEPDSNLYKGFRSSFFDDRSNCQQAGEACYEVMFSQGEESRGDSISVGAVHRKFAETLRLYFSQDFFNRLESVFVVEGDTLPEVQFSMVRQISPRVLARLQSNIAAGGGGIFYATDDHAYENQVRYLVTSLDTRFQNTATGIFIAFHHLEQNLNPVDQGGNQLGRGIAEMEMQRLQLMLTQDLRILADVASNWAVRFNVELSRGSTPYTLAPDDELRKKLTGGISVSF